MRPRRKTVLALAALLPLALGFATARAGEHHGRTLLLTVEGVVDAVETTSVGAGEPLTSVRLLVDDPEPRQLEVLLAPGSALHETGFEVEAGDRLRARIFLSDSDTVEAHKVRNLSRGTMVRLRTLRQVPLWDTAGRWQGGPGRDHHGSGKSGHGHRSGR
jgi:hypothetical protein